MAITVNFDIKMPNEPYVDDFSNGATHPAVYKGPQYLRVEKNISDGKFGAIVADGDTEAELENGIVAREGTTFHLINAQTHPFEAAYVSNNYTTGEVPDYTTPLGTTDDEGNAETFTYYWQDNTGIISQIYLHSTMGFKDGAYYGPEFRTHILTRESFFATIPNQTTLIQTEIDSGKHSAEKTAELTAYVEWLDGIATKYAEVQHWKIPFKKFPEFD